MAIQKTYGFAAAQCGKALPYRFHSFWVRGSASAFEAQPLPNSFSMLPERQSLSAL
jgi:hypothetical protein